MKKTVFLILYCLIAGIVFLSCDWGGFWDERRVFQIGVVVKTADQNFGYEIECPVNNLKDKTRTNSRFGKSAICMQYVWHRGGKKHNETSYLVLSQLSSSDAIVEVCVYDYIHGISHGKLNHCKLKEIVDDEQSSEISSDYVFDILRETHYPYLYTWDPKNSKLVIDLDELVNYFMEVY